MWGQGCGATRPSRGACPAWARARCDRTVVFLSLFSSTNDNRRSRHSSGTWRDEVEETRADLCGFEGRAHFTLGSCSSLGNECPSVAAPRDQGVRRGRRPGCSVSEKKKVHTLCDAVTEAIKQSMSFVLLRVPSEGTSNEAGVQCRSLACILDARRGKVAAHDLDESSPGDL